MHRKIFNPLIILTYLLLVFNCKDNIDVKKIYNQRVEVIKIFKRLSVFKRGDIIQLNIYGSNSYNEYFFKEKAINSSKKSLSFLKDNLQFDISKIDDFNNINTSDSVEYRKSITHRINSILNKMQELNINSFTSEFSPHGVELKIYLNESEMLYVPNKELLKNKEWMNYIKNAEKIDDNWYWKKY